MKGWKVRRGNTSVQDILCKDKNESTLSDLGSASTITFQVKKEATDSSALIAKTVGSGIEIDTPTEGYVRVTLSPSDTAQDPENYVMALEIKYSASEIYETIMYIDDEETDKFIVEQDII